ncbi:BatA domain-containing protein [Cellulophaga tyrosinoxydans]|uniref:N-terminal double-transmembrane domain-containing protein n=1 Tax=Cellulophaga tyrosinoxydans TaxID=504486 RepID=A0A1W1ZVR0_9FLAO|nr:BatA domain-containing protein [Cellulophaga tyrosinoxydans]SMC52148.1 N-terminal double-transmembrane domain-containing protein [Cellulophaga tyrosinoxydans]
MQFKNPEILWALLLLIIPILIHLLQLRRFKITTFTNVKMLQKVVSESRKSRSLKKWLLLATRLLLFAFLIMAFAQPYFAKSTAFVTKDTVIYLDNSFSMQAKKESVTLLESAVQDLLKSAPNDKNINLFTNNANFDNTTLKEIRNNLLSLPFSGNQLTLPEIQLKAQSLYNNAENTLKNLIVISDFQQHQNQKWCDSVQNKNTYFVKMEPNKMANSAIDSVYIAENTGETITLSATLSTINATDNIPVAIYNGEKLISKTSAVFNETNSAKIAFTINTNDPVKGKIVIEDNGLDYDNTFYFSIHKREKINVLLIAEKEENTFLSRIYTDEEFKLTKSTIANLNYSDLEKQNIIVLNELIEIPITLQQALNSFSSTGGTLVLIPNDQGKTQNYNTFLKTFGSTFSSKKSSQEITTISFDHPLYEHVFDRKVSNFQYPTVTNYFSLESGLPNILSYADGAPFLVGRKGVYFFTSALSGSYSNFKNSPLVVPTFYKMGVESLKQDELYTTIGTTNTTDIAVELSKDEVLKITKDDYEFIPLQQPFLNKVSLTFIDNPREDGNYLITSKNKILKSISFNYPRKESNLVYANLDELTNIIQEDSLTDLFQDLEKDNRVNELWKWFVILALLFALIEIGIQKYMK